MLQSTSVFFFFFFFFIIYPYCLAASGRRSIAWKHVYLEPVSSNLLKSFLSSWPQSTRLKGGNPITGLPSGGLVTRPRALNISSRRAWRRTMTTKRLIEVIKWNQIYTRGISLSTTTKMNTFLFADDQVIMADSDDNLQWRVFRSTLQNIAKDFGMEISP